MYLKCFSCRLYDSLICKTCNGYSHFEPINTRLYYYLNSQNKICGPVKAYMLPYYGVNQDSLVCSEEMRNWTKVSSVSELCFIPSVASLTASSQCSTDINITKNTFLSSLEKIPIITRIVYALFLLLLFVVAFFYTALFINSLNKTSMFYLLVLVGFVFNAVSVWGLWQLFRHQKKAGFWFAAISPSISIQCITTLFLGFKIYDDSMSDGSLVFFLGLTSFVAIMLSYLFIGVLYGCLYFKRKGVVYITYLNKYELVFPWFILRFSPIISIVLWTILLRICFV